VLLDTYGAEAIFGISGARAIVAWPALRVLDWSKIDGSDLPTAEGCMGSPGFHEVSLTRHSMGSPRFHEVSVQLQGGNTWLTIPIFGGSRVGNLTRR
jgi:hypothetical protein